MVTSQERKAALQVAGLEQAKAALRDEVSLLQARLLDQSDALNAKEDAQTLEARRSRRLGLCDRRELQQPSVRVEERAVAGAAEEHLGGVERALGRVAQELRRELRRVCARRTIAHRSLLRPRHGATAW